jgi:hypothetical protein
MDSNILFWKIIYLFINYMSLFVRFWL